MPSVRASDGVGIYAEAHGSGVPIVFSCGYNTTRENFRPQVQPLVRAGGRVVLWDYRGHGSSDAPPAPEAYSMEHVLDDLARVLDWGAPGQRVVLAGFSFGGLASLHFALRHPERVRGLVLLDSGPGFKNPEALGRWIAQIERIATLLETQGLRALLESRAADSMIGRRAEQPAARAAGEAIAAQDPHAVARFGRCVAGPVPGVLDDLPRIDVPALVLVGEQDETYLRAAEVMAARLPRAKHALIPGAGHVATLEEPDAVNRLLVDFLRSLPAE
jgi:pimeloyl-ACP methyl ester carboxylesterase